MTASAISTSTSYNVLPKDGRSEPENQWPGNTLNCYLRSAILNEVRASATNRLTEKTLLVLGDMESGKSHLLSKMIGKEQTVPSGVGLEHLCVPVKDDEREDSTQVNAWILEEEDYAPALLPLIFNEKTFDKSVVWLVISMTKPWNMMESLDKWVNVLSASIDRMKIDPVIMKQHSAKVEKLFKEYIDPSVAKTTPVTPERGSDLPLGDNTLTHNLGVPIVVVVTKADYVAVLEKEMDYKEEKFDFLQMSLRNWCLKHGAALVMTSARESSSKNNLKTLHGYMAHLLYGLKFDEDGNVLDRDSVFIPVGWDNEKKIGILDDNLGEIRPTESFENVITAPPPLVKLNAADAGSQAEDDQEFVKKIQQVLQQPVPSRMESPAGVQKPVDRRASPAQSSPKKADGPRGSLGAGGANESALSSFFNTLLNKNNKASPGVTPPSSTAAVVRTASPSSTSRVDAAAELDRLSKGRESPPPVDLNLSENPDPSP